MTKTNSPYFHTLHPIIALGASISITDLKSVNMSSSQPGQPDVPLAVLEIYNDGLKIKGDNNKISDILLQAATVYPVLKEIILQVASTLRVSDEEG